MLAALTGAVVPTVEATESPVEEVKSEAAPEAEAEAPKEDAKVEDTEKEDQPKPQRSVEEANALERARTALRRDGVPVAVIDGLEQEKLLRWGGSRAKAHADTDDAFRQLGELRKEKETWTAKAAETPKESAPTEPTEQPFDLKTLGTTLQEALLDEKAAEAVGGAIKSLNDYHGRNTQQLRSELASLKQTNEQLSMAFLRIEERDARRELSDRFPQLKDASDFAKVQEKMVKLAPSGAYESMRDLMAEAATIIFPEAASQRDVNGLRSRMNGQPTVPDRKTLPKSLSSEERSIDFLKELEKRHGL